MRGVLDRLTPTAAAWAVWSLGATLRVSVSGTEPLRPLWEQHRPLIYVVWHGRILMSPWANVRFRRTLGARRVTVMASRSRDGELVARYVERFGLGVVRGSTSRGGAMALRALASALRAGEDVVIVPDGPRGPRGGMAPGVVALAALTSALVVPFAVSAHPALTLRTWDRFQIPLPFARMAVVFGTPVTITATGERETIRRELTTMLDAVTAAADRLAVGEPRLAPRASIERERSGTSRHG